MSPAIDDYWVGAGPKNILSKKELPRRISGLALVGYGLLSALPDLGGL